MKKIINKILRDRNVIDNGISDVIFDTLDPMIQSTIARELNIAEVASKAMQGLLANPDMSDTSKAQITMISYEYALDLLNHLDDVRNSCPDAH